MVFAVFAVVSLGIATTTIAPHASAGAPNYECIAKGVRIGIDQWRDKALIRRDGQATEVGSTQKGDQNGERLGIEIVTASGIWKVDVTGFGKLVTIDGPAGKLIGTCTNVAGNLVLAQTIRTTTIRTIASTDIKGDKKKTGNKSTKKAKTILTVPKGTFVWNAGNFDPTSSTLGSKDQAYISVVDGKPLPMNHMNMTGSQGWVEASALLNVCAVEDQNSGWTTNCK